MTTISKSMNLSIFQSVILTYKKISIHPFIIITKFPKIKRNLTFSIWEQRPAVWNERCSHRLWVSMGSQQFTPARPATIQPSLWLGFRVCWHVRRPYLNSANEFRTRGLIISEETQTISNYWGETVDIEDLKVDFRQVCFLRQKSPLQLEQWFMVVELPRKPQLLEQRRWPSGVWDRCSSAIDFERKFEASKKIEKENWFEGTKNLQNLTEITCTNRKLVTERNTTKGKQNIVNKREKKFPPFSQQRNRDEYKRWEIY